MLVYDDITQLSSHPAVVRAYRKFLSLRDDSYPDMNYFGINFTNGEISSIKFYFSIYKRIALSDAAEFLPHIDDFKRYYSFWESSKVRSGEHTGCAFSVKFSGKKEPKVGFHYRLSPGAESFRLLGEPNDLPFSVSELGTRPGVNYEYEAGKMRGYKRRYYYLEKETHKAYIASRFGKPFANECRLCEFTESDQGSKVILWSPDYIKKYLERPLYFGNKEKTILERLYSDFGLISVMEGFYENENTISTYFFNTLGERTGNINEGSANFHMDTLKLFF